MARIARGRVFSGSRASAAVVPTSSMPTKAKTAIWKPATKPMKPVGNMPPSFHRLENFASAPFGATKPRRTMTAPTITRAAMARILMMANQNSISPKALTEGMFSRRRSTIVASAGIQSWRSGHQNEM